ncbi:MAG TPA: acetyl-CoA carboxylase biotin carboxylase subunit [Rugosimonospora sp.]|nr:acetyl-CoA carboxylase biotin carboxylase subunit [Rugosimonospora sp.]
MFESILIANRGEIAVRIARACRELGVRVIAVYSTEDRDSMVVRLADDAVAIGPAQAKLSYLNMAAVMEAARMTKAEAIHPGYGFLSENPDFAEVCEAEGVAFIGPPASVLSRLGDKTSARRIMQAAGLPLLPGCLDPVEDVEAAQELADSIGYPVIVKAAAGGGGRGLQVVPDRGGFVHSFQSSRVNAQAFFGDGRLYVERYLRSARHVEVQVLCDAYGNAVSLGARDCSVQRRYQKLVEEAPPPGLPTELVDGMCAAAVRGARSVGYVGPGTFEFLVDPDGNYYFMEVNCRIQVEHPVTEMVTGVDLIAEQIRVAAGEPLRLTQQDVQVRGASIECRINAEDPDQNFVPRSGVLTEFIPPGGPFVRLDTHAYPGYRVPHAFDSLLAKLIVWAPDRDQAITRMLRALAEFRISGDHLATTIGFLGEVLDDHRFRAAAHDTSLLPALLSERER